MSIVAQIICVMVHKRANVSFTNTKLLGVSEEVVWIIFVTEHSPQNVSHQGGYHITVFQA